MEAAVDAPTVAKISDVGLALRLRTGELRESSRNRDVQSKKTTRREKEKEREHNRKHNTA